MIGFTESAIKRLSSAVEPGDIIRIGIRGGGCSGMSYAMSIENKHEEEDTVFEFENLKVCVDKKSAFMLTETIVDYVETCGCGESFSCG